MRQLRAMSLSGKVDSFLLCLLDNCDSFFVETEIAVTWKKWLLKVSIEYDHIYLFFSAKHNN